MTFPLQLIIVNLHSINMKSFNIPLVYRSELVTTINNKRKADDKLKKDFTPTEVKIGRLTFYIARHFGFCYGVENAIEIAFQTVTENPDKRIFLLSEMIHNPQVNEDLVKHGVRFIQDTFGKPYIDWSEITKDDIVIIPAFGTTRETNELLESKGINPVQYNTTCPFVEKVWKRGSQIGKKGYSLILHGKPQHEETRATFSQCAIEAPTLIIKNIEEAKQLEKYIRKEATQSEFEKEFTKRFTPDFSIEKDLEKIGVINQTTMLAEDTEEIANYLKEVICDQYKAKDENVKLHFADTRDTLCYATNDNQNAVKGMLDTAADFAIVIGGYNSSNTSHLVELCEEKLPTYYIKDAAEIISSDLIQHFNFHKKEMKETKNYMADRAQKILITAGASCPDAIVESVIQRMASLHGEEFNLEQILANLN